MTVIEEQQPTRISPPRRPAWWRRPWMVPLSFVVAVFLVYALPPYLSLDPAQSRVPVPPGNHWYYPTLVSHIFIASIAMVCCMLQVWPWLRLRYPVLHRYIGRVYVFAGAIPASICGFVLSVPGFFGLVGQLSDLMLAVLWFSTTVLGYRAGRARRYADHRRWMIRSFALCMSIISNRLWGFIWGPILIPHLNDMFGGNKQVLIENLAGLTTWPGWVIPLIISQLWLDRTRRRKTTAFVPA